MRANSRERAAEINRDMALANLVAAGAEAERLQWEARMSGALPGEITLVYRYRMGRGNWPYLA